MPRISELSERDIERAFLAADGELTRAAALLGIHRISLWKRMKQLGLSTERKTIVRRDPEATRSA